MHIVGPYAGAKIAQIDAYMRNVERKEVMFENTECNSFDRR